MGIGWLWHVTRGGDDDALRLANEDRAAASYRRWRALHEGAARLVRHLRGGARRRAARRDLESLSDERLRDIGLRRSVDGQVVVERREPRPALARLRPASPLRSVGGSVARFPETPRARPSARSASAPSAREASARSEAGTGIGTGASPSKCA